MGLSRDVRDCLGLSGRLSRVLMDSGVVSLTVDRCSLGLSEFVRRCQGMCGIVRECRALAAVVCACQDLSGVEEIPK